MESNSPIDDDTEELMLLSKPQRGRLRLPPLSTAEVTGNSGCLENNHKAEDEEKDIGVLSANSSATLRSENLLTPNVYKHPTSPSNLSIQFAFDEAPMEETNEPEQLVTCKARYVGPRTSDGHKRLQGPSPSLTGRTRGNKGYKTLRNDQRPRTTEAGKRLKVGAYKTLSANTAVKSTSSSSHVGKSNGKNARTVKVAAERLQSGTHALDVINVDQRKSSIYDLREFLSLPARIERGRISPINGAKQGRKTPVYQKRPVKHSKSHPKASPRVVHNKSSDDYMCDVFEFLALSTETERPSTAKAEKKLNELTEEKMSKAKSARTRKAEIPSVVVADWTIKDDFPRTKRLSRKNREIPKANFPTNYFPNNSEALTTPPGEVRGGSTYDLREFLNLHELNRKGVTKVRAEDLKMLSKPKPKERKPGERETEAQYDLREFLTFLESRTTSGDGGSAGSDVSLERPYRSALSNAESYKNRSLSVYDIYEFLKTTNPLTAPEGHQDNGNVKRKASIIDLTADFFAISSPAVNDNDRSNHVTGGKPLDEAGKLQGSAYNLREFLRLPAVAHDVSSSEAMKAKAIGKP